jgi:hypothetical protein
MGDRVHVRVIQREGARLWHAESKNDRRTRPDRQGDSIAPIAHPVCGRGFNSSSVAGQWPPAPSTGLPASLPQIEDSQANGSGGAIFTSGGKLAISGIVFRLNEALNGDGCAIKSSAPLTVTRSDFENNAALGGGCIAMAGGKLSLENVDLSFCAALGDGGAIWLSNTKASIVTTSPARRPRLQRSEWRNCR